MDSQQQQKIFRDKVEEVKLKHQGKEEAQQPPPPSTAAASPPSASSSPNHEFSFTISLHQPTKAPTSIAVDLSPADEIFFHGHLLPLHLLSHLPVSPRSSTNSLDSFTLPIRELLENQNPNRTDQPNSNSNSINRDPNQRPKSKSFSLFGLSKWRKGYENREKEEREKQRRKLRFDVTEVLKRYMRMVRPLFRGRREKMQRQKQPYSFSGSLSPRGKQELIGRRGQFSAPASMRTSPTNSGLLVASPTTSCNTSDSTMEELQAAIQAAIAHCKNSIAMEDKKIKC